MAADDSEAAGSLAEVESPVETSSRDDVAAAFDAVEARDAPAAAAPGADAPSQSVVDAPAREGRDALGRFAPKREGTPAEGTPAAGPAAPVAPVAPPVTPAEVTPRHLAKAPASWSPTEAAHWEKVPFEVREAVARREYEVQRVMQESAQARNGLATLQQTVAPYLQNINAANGGDVVGAIKEFLGYDNRLRHGSQIEKAKAVTQLIRGYGVDIAALDNELAGAQHSPETSQQNAIREALERELAPLRQHLLAQQQAQQRAEYEQQQALAQRVDEGLTDFASDKAHPHYNLVRAEMADLLEIATAQGRKMTLDEAYERACWQNPQTRSILIAGQQSAGAQTAHLAAQRARAAAVGVRNAPRAGAPANAVPPESRSRADDIAAAFAQHAGEA